MEHQRDLSASGQAAAFEETSPRPWLRYYDENIPATIDYRVVPLYAWLDEAADRYPSSVACAFYNTRISYGRVRKDAERIAANLAAHGVKPGDRVGLMLPNLPQTMLLFWGVLKAGAVVVMINPLYMEKEISYQVKDAGIRHLVTIDLCWPKFDKLRDSLGIEKYFVTCIAEGLSFPLNILHRLKNRKENAERKVPYDRVRVFPYADLLKGKKRLCVPVPDPKNTMALLQYTGGTTGRSKGAMLSHFNVGANAQQVRKIIHWLDDGTQVFMAVLPFFHVYGLNVCLVVPTLFRARVVPVPRFAPLELLKSMKKHKATVLPGAPSLYIALLKQKQKEAYMLNTLRLCISGSAPMPVEMQRCFEEQFKTRMIEGYGLSEASPITHLTLPNGLRKMGSIGFPLPDTEARIVDMELGTVPLAPGKVGELVIRGPQVMSGYWKNPDETAGTIRNGWLYTGDIATMDEEGFFSIVDRKKDMIIVGGYNVAPREIDEVLYEHPKVSEAVSVGIAHPTRGEVIKAYIVLREGEHCDKAEIVGWCRDRLANYKVPRMVEFRKELPKTLVGKILRRALREEEERRTKLRAVDGITQSVESESYFDSEHKNGQENDPVSLEEKNPASVEERKEG
ncbi:long-chain fatty acid--CoA ligase [Desulfovibrio sp. OttesenSCG-928-A18]|nr:long-chain fatty acid--CoA ligase [Desulfovibrio sp. OttesenSCG-928-A18]